MRRPMIPVSVAYITGILGGYFAKGSLIWPAYISGAFIVLLCLQIGVKKWENTDSLPKKRKISIAVQVFFILLGSWNFWFAEKAIEETDLPDGESIELTGEVVSFREKEEKTLEMKVETLRGNVLVRYSMEKYVKEQKGFINPVGRKVKFTGKMIKPDKRRNPRCFDYRAHLKTQGVCRVMTAKTFVIGKVRRYFINIAAQVSIDFRQRLSLHMSKSSMDVMVSTMLGNRFGMDEEIYKEFQRNGTAHIMAVSGLHIAMIYGLLVFLFGKVRRIGIAIIVIGLLFFYAAMAGFSPSVVRAFLMIGIHILGTLDNRRYDMLSAACVAMVILLTINPFSLFNTGFQMSFLAIITISIFLPYLERSSIQISGWKQTVVMPLILQGVMSPFIAYTFNYFSIIAFVANIPMVFLAGILIPIGIVALVVTTALPETTGFFAMTLEVSGKAMLHCNTLFYGKGGCAIDVISPTVFFVAFFYGALFLMTSEWGAIMIIRRRAKSLVAALAFCGTLSLGIHVLYDDSFDKMPLIFVDVGQGNCLCLKTSSGKVILVDGGGSKDYDVGRKVVKPFLLKNRLGKVNLAFVTHRDEDHYGGIKSLKEDGLIEKVVFHENLKGKVDKGSHFVKTGTVVAQQKDGFFVEVLGPINISSDENGNSLVLKIHIYGITVLAPGDISSKEENDLVSYYGRTGKLKSDVLISPHHGSKYSSSHGFIKAVNPKFIVIQVGRNKYGHPAPSVIDNYKEKGIMIYRNDKDGAVGVDGGEHRRVIRQIQ